RPSRRADRVEEGAPGSRACSPAEEATVFFAAKVPSLRLDRLGERQMEAALAGGHDALPVGGLPSRARAGRALHPLPYQEEHKHHDEKNEKLAHGPGDYMCPRAR